MAFDRREVGGRDQLLQISEHVGRHPPEVVRWLGSQVDAPVAIDRDRLAARPVDTFPASGLDHDKRTRRARDRTRAARHGRQRESDDEPQES
jgi:hypothetical protein